MSNKSGKNRLSVVVIGHVDSGKSTTTGHLVQLCGGVDKRTMEKLEKEAKDRGKESFKFAFLTDKTGKERERGITIESTVTSIETENTFMTLTDSPGHKDFIKNMITGTSGCDCAIEVIPASQGEFETALSSQGQSREHATLAFTMGVKIMLVVVNKMDTIPAADREARFNEIKNEVVNNVLKKIGYRPASVAVIPISGFEGWNLVEHTSEMPWYKGYSYEHPTPSGPVIKTGVTVYDWINGLVPPHREVDKPLRICCDCAYKISGIGTVGTGHVQTGVLKVGDNIVACPANFTTEVKSVEMHHQSLEKAYPGDSIGFNLKNIAVNQITRGNVVGHDNTDAPRTAKLILAQTVVLASTSGKDKASFNKNYTPICDAHKAHFPMKVKLVVSKFDKRNGKTTETADENTTLFLKNGEAGMIEFIPQREVCLEPYSSFAGLGRGVCREGSKTVAVFVVKSVIEAGELPTGKGAAAKGGAGKGGQKAAATKGKK